VGNLIGSTVLNSSATGIAVKAATSREPGPFEELHGYLWVRNSIVRGGSLGSDITTFGPTVNLDWSNVTALARVSKSPEAVEGALTLGSHNSTSSPQFVSASDLRLTAASALIDAGASATILGLKITPEMPITDLGVADAYSATRLRAGKGSSLTSLVDIGATEFQPSALALTGARLSQTRVRPGAKNVLSGQLSANAKLQVTIQKMQASRATTVTTQTFSSKAGAVDLTLTMKSRSAALTKGQYRLAITPTSVDGAKGVTAYIAFEVI
jgi:hypothetical protein